MANDGIDLDIKRGEIHCLLGENGAGKTTLMRVLYGLYQPDAGEILLNGKPIQISSPRAALTHHIGMVHQHFRLVPTLSVEENVILGLDEGTGPFLNLRKTRKKIGKIAAGYGLQVDPQTKVWQLSVGQRQRVEILKALYREADILIMDEPTSVLTPQEVDQLFTTLRMLVDDGLTIIFITHKLDEVMQVSNRVTVLRQGKLVATLPTSQMDKPSLARLMVGREVVFRLKGIYVDDPVFGKISVYDLVMTRLRQMADPGVTLDPFQGPLYDRKGILRVLEDCTLSVSGMTTMQWAVEGIVGPWSGEP